MDMIDILSQVLESGASSLGTKKDTAIPDKVQKAISKLKAEMEKKTENPYIQGIGESLISHLSTNPEDAEAFLNPSKTVEKSIEVMRNIAAKRRKGNFAMIPPREGEEIILKYFRSNEAAGGPGKVNKVVQESKPVEETQSDDEDDENIDE